MTTAEELTREIDGIREALLRKQLSPEDLDQLCADLEQIEQRLEGKPEKPRRSILELEGLGQDLWRSIDVEAYLKRERDSWR